MRIEPAGGGTRDRTNPMRNPPAPGKTLITFCPIKSSFASADSSVSRPSNKEALALSCVCSARAAEPGLSSVRFYNKSDVDASNGDMSPPQSRQLWCGGAKYCESCKQGRGLATRVRRTLPAAPETYAIVPDAYIYGRRQKKRTPSAAAKKNTAPRAPPEPYAAEAILTRRYPSQPRSPRRSRYRRRWSRSGP